MSTEEKFNAAVNVIKNLPKNGSFQPSHELMLRFYAYFKQAKEGPATGSRPPFWDIVGRAKWDAWAKLGNMSSTAAMEAYVDELNKIVETMAYTDNVADFLKSLDSFYARVPPDVLETCIGPALEKIRSSPNSPLASREGTPSKRANGMPNGLLNEPVVNGALVQAGLSDDSAPGEESSGESDEEDFLDSIEALPEGRMRKQQTMVVSNGYHPTPDGSIQKEPLEDILMRTVTSLRKEVSQLNEAVARIETKQALASRQHKMLFGSMSKETVAFVVGWPIVVHFGLAWLLRKDHSR